MIPLQFLHEQYPCQDDGPQIPHHPWNLLIEEGKVLQDSNFPFQGVRMLLCFKVKHLHIQQVCRDMESNGTVLRHFRHRSKVWLGFHSQVEIQRSKQRCQRWRHPSNLNLKRFLSLWCTHFEVYNSMNLSTIYSQTVHYQDQ